MIEFAEQIGISYPTALVEHIPHYRFFELRNKYLKITIRPDAGVEHGWFLSGNANKIYNDRTDANNLFKIYKQENNKLLYTVSLEKNYKRPENIGNVAESKN
jgi:DEAD/DEAH box helicase domain-containing protein